MAKEEKKITISTYWLNPAEVGRCSHCKDAKLPVREFQLGSTILRLCGGCIEALKELLAAVA